MPATPPRRTQSQLLLLLFCFVLGVVELFSAFRNGHGLGMFVGLALAAASFVLPATSRLLRSVSVVAFLLLLVRVASPAPRGSTAPDACPSHLPQGCATIKISLQASSRDVGAAVKAWASKNHGIVLTDARFSVFSVLHFQFTSFVWGFADDTWINTSCDSEQNRQTIVSGISMLRLGRGDLGVNAKRLALLSTHLQNTFADANGQCDL